jgi:ubiquitin C-terminal hydrolase
MPRMEKALRCTVCTWRGTAAEASAVRVQPVELPPQLEEVQQAYEEKQLEEEQLGGHRAPACPSCGHHTLAVKLHRGHAAV